MNQVFTIPTVYNTRQFCKRQFFFLLPMFIMLVINGFYIENHSPALIYAAWHSQHPVLTQCIRWITDWGNMFLYLPYPFILAIAIKQKKNTVLQRFVGYFILMQLTISLFAVNFLKIITGVPRPYTFEKGLHPLSFQSQYYSFPSGHTAEIMGTCGPFAHCVKPYVLSFTLGLVPAIMGFTRIYLGQHYPTDILASALIGSVTTYCIFALSLRQPQTAS